VTQALFSADQNLIDPFQHQISSDAAHDLFWGEDAISSVLYRWKDMRRVKVTGMQSTSWSVHVLHQKQTAHILRSTAPWQGDPTHDRAQVTWPVKGTIS